MDTNCSFNKEKLSAYLDNELSEKERLEVKKHISKCKECLNLLSLLQKNDLEFADFIKTDLPPSFWEKYNLKLGMKLASQTKNHFYRRFLLPVAASFLGIIALYYFMTLPNIKPIVYSTTVTESAASKDILKKSESALIGMANLNEDDSKELMILQKALLESNLIEKIREYKTKTNDKDLQDYLSKLDAVFTLMQNEYSPAEIRILKEVITKKGLIEENRLRQNSIKEVKL